MKVFSSPAVKKALDEVIIMFRQETGVSIDAVFEPTGQLLRRIDAGESFDVMIAVTESFGPLTTVIEPHTLTSVARAGIGVAVKRGTPNPTSPPLNPSSKPCARQDQLPTPASEQAAHTS